MIDYCELIKGYKKLRRRQLADGRGARCALGQMGHAAGLKDGEMLVLRGRNLTGDYWWYPALKKALGLSAWEQARIIRFNDTVARSAEEVVGYVCSMKWRRK